jgi:transposase-like protein
MKAQLNADTASAVADLQQKWSTLQDVDRARAVHAIHQAGTSLRQLAKELNCSPTLIRNLNKAAQAPQLHHDLARQGKISTRELVRRSKAVATLRARKDRETVERECVNAAQDGGRLICDWLQEEKLSGVFGEQIVDEARRLVAKAKHDGELPQHKVPQGTPVAEIIQRSRPPVSIYDDISSVGWYAAWLARWAYFAMPDSSIRHKALNIALERQIRG